MAKVPTIDVKVPKKPISFRVRVERNFHLGRCSSGVHNANCTGRGIMIGCVSGEGSDFVVRSICTHISWRQV